MKLVKITKYVKFNLFGTEHLEYRPNTLNLSTFGELVLNRNNAIEWSSLGLMENKVNMLNQPELAWKTPGDDF